ncbi:ABC transporter transmembrane domain-containing protein, partial [Streptomyces sp. DSM 41033]|uniref:ABC transporter transmembrane domain-containing protein n=1 Tax=Streptomyces sp. DSM 41033 TaxID=3448655 RepID=UPI00404028CE
AVAVWVVCRRGRSERARDMRLDGALITYLPGSALVLLGLAVLIGVPAAVLGIGPLLRPLQARDEAQREQMGIATSQAGDIVAGLRILRGIGGEARFAERFRRTSQQVRRAGESAGRMEAWLQAAGVLLPGLVTVGIVWFGAHLALNGAITA